MAALTPVQGSPGLLLGHRYRLGDLIAAGGMGEVWRATDLVLERPVAVKLLHSAGAEREEDLTRFRAEARHAGALSHPGIAQVHDYCEAGPSALAYLVMELVDGPSLRGLLDEGPLDPARTMSVIAQAARALQAAHTAGLVHRDIKPGNLLVTRSGEVKITDFGIARAAGSTPLTSPGDLIGTPAYLAPERASGAPAMPAADLYALGIVAFQCLTGKPPFSGPPLAVALAHCERPLPPLPPSVPAEVAALVAGLTAKDPLARPASAEEVAERAEHLRTALSATAAPRRGTRKGRAARRAVYALAAAAVAAIAAIGWGMTGPHETTSAHPQPSPQGAGHQSSTRASHPVHRATPSRGTGIAGAADAPPQDTRSTAPYISPERNASPAMTDSPARTPAPTAIPASGAPASSGALAPSQPPAPSETPAPSEPAPSETPTPTGAPTPTGTPTSGTPTSGPSSSPVTAATSP